MMPTGDNSSRPWDLGANAADGMMSHHFHLVVEPPQPTVLAGMKWLLGTRTLNEILQIVSVNLFEQVPVAELLAATPAGSEEKVSEQESQYMLAFNDL
jgi:hypothetical protein